MLPTYLLIHRPLGETLEPKYLRLQPQSLALAQTLIKVFQVHQGVRLGELDRQLQALEGDSTDYRLKRGLAHLLKSAHSEFEVVSPYKPQLLRERVFRQVAALLLSPQTSLQVLEQVAAELSSELETTVDPQALRQGLYADLPENRILTRFDTPTPEALIHRYNLAQVQGLFYRASELVLHVLRNDPGEYKLLFRYLKLFQLMAYIEGDADHGFTISIDGPVSLFQPSTRYGLAIAKLIPALLHVSRWRLEATLIRKDPFSGDRRSHRFCLEPNGQLVSHYPPGKPFDSLIEQAFVERWAQQTTEWKLEREVDLIPIPGSVMIPDFRLVHPDGRTVLLEIVGYWRPEYLRKKFAQVRKANSSNLILAISERLNLEKAGIQPQEIPVPVVWFKDKLQPKSVLALLGEA
jgi:predicted nuclease of restriction endonuclease-like RecB superfamily